jgi:acyl carrier protein
VSPQQTDQIDSIARRVLGDIAPEADIAALDPHAAIQDTLDLDSVDFLNFVTALYEETGVDIPERDYPEVTTLAGCVVYIAAHR